MDGREQTIIKLSLDVLRDALGQTDKARIDTPAVRLALRCLLPHVAARWPLTQFWEGAGGDNPIGRFQSCNAALNGIVLQLKASGSMVD